jgi:hypothetical protein
MKKLEDIPKENIFKTPEGYFDRLPGVVQSRIAEKSKQRTPFFQTGFALRYALPVLILAAAGIFWFNNTSRINSLTDIETELENVSPDQLSIFLNDTDLSTDELIETMTWSATDLQDLESEVYSTLEVTSEEIESVLDDYDVEL